MSDTHAETAFARKAPVAYVAEKQIPAAPPPSNAVGPVKWLKDNLFSGVVNSILTICSIILIVFLAYEIVPWLVNSSWSPEEMSLQGCRAEASGACFAVINERFNQFIFGFYPADAYWRPSLAFALLIAALAPVLFDRVPRQVLILTALYPLIGYFLIWGGSIWFPVAILIGPVIGIAVFQYLGNVFEKVVGEAFGPLVTLTASVLAVFFWWYFARRRF